MIDLMLDIETIGRGPGCIVTSVAVVPFHMNAKELTTHEESVGSFLNNLLIGEQLAKGFKLNTDTLSWWLKQDGNVRLAMFSGNVPLHIFRDGFTTFLKNVKSEFGSYRIWATAPKLDFGCLSYLFTSEDVEYPVLFSAERCARTLRETAKLLNPVTFKLAKPKALHDSADDCNRQIIDIQEAYRLLKGATDAKQAIETVVEENKIDVLKV